jgi:hypothetical protein
VALSEQSLRITYVLTASNGERWPSPISLHVVRVQTLSAVLSSPRAPYLTMNRIFSARNPRANSADLRGEFLSNWLERIFFNVISFVSTSGLTKSARKCGKYQPSWPATHTCYPRPGLPMRDMQAEYDPGKISNLPTRSVCEYDARFQ